MSRSEAERIFGGRLAARNAVRSPIVRLLAPLSNFGEAGPGAGGENGSRRAAFLRSGSVPARFGALGNGSRTPRRSLVDNLSKNRSTDFRPVVSRSRSLCRTTSCRLRRIALGRCGAVRHLRSPFSAISSRPTRNARSAMPAGRIVTMLAEANDSGASSLRIDPAGDENSSGVGLGARGSRASESG